MLELKACTLFWPWTNVCYINIGLDCSINLLQIVCFNQQKGTENCIPNTVWTRETLALYFQLMTYLVVLWVLTAELLEHDSDTESDYKEDFWSDMEDNSDNDD